MTAIETIRTYCHLQAQLVRTLLERERPKDTQYFRDLKPGSLHIDGTRWEYRKHGGGVAFSSSSGVEVDAHVGMATFPDAFDAWRLLLYCESVGIEHLTHDGRTYEANYDIYGEEPVRELIEALCASGLAKEVTYGDGLPHRLYELT
jgi:hypothetical protein